MKVKIKKSPDSKAISRFLYMVQVGSKSLNLWHKISKKIVPKKRLLNLGQNLKAAIKLKVKHLYIGRAPIWQNM
jgi:hypothetical protein